MPPNNPFRIAEQLIHSQRDTSWVRTLEHIKDMILMPMMVLYFLFRGTPSLIMTVSTFFRAYQSWRSFLSLQEARFAYQRMKMASIVGGGPFITTNDPLYMPYVYADAVMRTAPRLDADLRYMLLHPPCPQFPCL